MNRRSIFVLAAILAAAVAAPFASAQTPANIIVALGNGQLVCASNCTGAPPPSFPGPAYAIVVDANGNPIPSYPVTWNVVSGAALINGGSSFTSNTDNTGTTSVTANVYNNFSSAPFLQSTFSVTAGSVTATYTVTNALANTGLGTGPVGAVQVQVDFSQSLQQGSTLSGTSGGTGTPFTIRVYSLVSFNGTSVVQGVSVRLINDDGTSGPSPTIPSAYCQTGPGADPYSVLTDATGTAVCTPVFGPVGGTSHQVAVLVGGVPAGIWSVPGTPSGSLYNPGGITYNPGTAQPLPGFGLSGFVNLSVKAATVGSVVVTSGNNQAANPGQALPNPLVATMKDTSGNPLASQGVTWSVSPAAAATLSNTSSITNSSGQVSTNVTFASTASGTVTIKAASSSNSAIAATFTATAVPPVTIISLTKIGGDSQSAAVGAAFASPLQVQLAASGGSVANITVSFSSTGPITLSGSSATTNANGIAQVTATAGSTTGNATVSASAGGMSVVFNLAVVPAVPIITPSNFVNGADLQKGSISACGLASIAGSGIIPALSGITSGPLVGPLPLTLAGVAVAFNGTDFAPLLSVGPNAILFQLPCDVTPGTVPVTVTVSGSSVTVNVTVLPASPGLFSTVQSDGVMRAVLERPDGSFVSLANPARRGENVTAFVTGLGPVSPSVATNAVPIPGTASTVNGQVIVGVNNAGTAVLSSQLSSDRQGVYTITFQIPQGAPQSNSVPFSIGVIPVGSSSVYYSAGSQIPVQ